MYTHIVSATISFIRIAKGTGVIRTFKGCTIPQRRMVPFPRKVLQMLIKRLLLQKDFVAELAFVLLLFVMLVQVHTESARLCSSIVALRTHVEPRVILQILALSWH